MNTVDYLAFDKTVKEAKNERGSTDHADGLPESQRRAQILQDLSTRAETKGTCSPSQKDHDPVNYPNHYIQGGIECIEAEAVVLKGLSGFEGFLTGNCLKYLWRWKSKNGLEDLKKCRWYLNKLIETLEGCHGSQDSPKNGRVNCPS